MCLEWSPINGFFKNDQDDKLDPKAAAIRISNKIGGLGQRASRPQASAGGPRGRRSWAAGRAPTRQGLGVGA